MFTRRTGEGCFHGEVSKDDPRGSLRSPLDFLQDLFKPIQKLLDIFAVLPDVEPFDAEGRGIEALAGPWIDIRCCSRVWSLDTTSSAMMYDESPARVRSAA